MNKVSFLLFGVMGVACVPSGDPRADNARLIRQSTSSDCGPAALATLFTFYLDVPTTEREMMRLANANPTTGTSLRGMESAAAAKSLDSGSFRMDFKTLQSQMEQFKTPVIVRMLNPEPHFAVVLDVEGPEVGLADPAVGNILISRKAFLKRWLIPGNNKEGYVFVAATPIGHVNSGNLAAARRDLARMRRALQTTRPPMFSPTR